MSRYVHMDVKHTTLQSSGACCSIFFSDGALLPRLVVMQLHFYPECLL